MRLSDILATVGVAVATMAMTLGFLVPRHVTAEGEKSAIKPTIAVPELTVDDCVFVVSTDKPEYAPGQRPVLTVKATNTGREPLSTSVSLSITATEQQWREARAASRTEGRHSASRRRPLWFSTRTWISMGRPGSFLACLSGFLPWGRHDRRKRGLRQGQEGEPSPAEGCRPLLKTAYLSRFDPSGAGFATNCRTDL